MMPTPDPTPALRVLQTTRDSHNIALSLQLLSLYAGPFPRRQLQNAAILRPPVPTFAEFVHALVRLRN